MINREILNPDFSCNISLSARTLSASTSGVGAHVSLSKTSFTPTGAIELVQ